jgi:hypothetical protein
VVEILTHQYTTGNANATQFRPINPQNSDSTTSGSPVRLQACNVVRAQQANVTRGQVSHGCETFEPQISDACLVLKMWRLLLGYQTIHSVLVNSTVQQYGMVDSTTVLPVRSTVDVYSLVMDGTVLHETVERFVASTSEYDYVS